MRALVLCLLLLLISSVAAQEQKVTIRVGGGLNTRSSDFDIKPSESRIAHNVDFSRNLGSVSKRHGYLLADSLGAGYDSLLGLFGAYFSDGTKRLAFAVDSAGVGWGGVYVGDTALSNIGTTRTRLTQYWNTQYPTTFATFDDKLYAVNGVQKGIVWNGTTTRSYPMYASGEPKVVPISGGLLNGEYRYAFRLVYWDGGVSYGAWGSGYVTASVKVRNGSVLITDFAFPISDSTHNSIDSAWVLALRTKANPGRLDGAEYMYPLIASPYAIAKSVAGSFSGVVYIDNIPDASLISGFPIKSMDTTMVGRDSLGASKILYGAPTFLDATTIGYADSVETNHPRGGIYCNYPTSNDTLGVVYNLSIYDSTISMESDTSRGLTVFEDTTPKSSFSITVGLPRLPTSVSGVLRRLYKSYIFSGGNDTVQSVYQRYIGRDPRVYPLMNILIIRLNEIAKWNKFYPRYFGLSCYENNQGIACTFDSAHIVELKLEARGPIRTPPFLIRQIGATDTSFVDSTRYDSMLSLPIFVYANPPHLINGLFAYGGRMWSWNNSNLYWSSVDSASRFGVFNSVSVNADDGDAITAAWPTRRAIRVFKNKSSYNVYQDGNLQWNLSEVTNNIGCIAPKSHVVGMNGHYYLSSEGFVLENEGAYLERTATSKLISANLNNFDALPIATLANTYGTYNDGKCLWTVGDTTYVYDEKADAWSTWGFKIGGSTMYNSGSSVKFLPGDTMYFYSPNGKSVFNYGALEYDTALATGKVTAQWKSPPLLLSPKLKVLNSVGTWTSGADTLGLTGTVMTETGAGLYPGGLSFVFTSKATNRYQRSAIPRGLPALYYQIFMQNVNSQSWSINAFDLWFTEVGDTEMK